MLLSSVTWTWLNNCPPYHYVWLFVPRDSRPNKMSANAIEELIAELVQFMWLYLVGWGIERWLWKQRADGNYALQHVQNTVTKQLTTPFCMKWSWSRMKVCAASFKWQMTCKYDGCDWSKRACVCVHVCYCHVELVFISGCLHACLFVHSQVHHGRVKSMITSHLPWETRFTGCRWHNI